MKNAAHSFWIKIIILFSILVVCFFVSFFVGRFRLSLKVITDIILSKVFLVTPYWNETVETVVLKVRLPRILLAIISGGMLSLSGASYQNLTRNPLVSPDILGVSAGAGFGAALAMVNNASWWQIQLFAFVFGAGAVFISWFINHLFGRQDITVLILAGVVVASFFQAMLSIVKTLADTDNALPAITFWLMGSLSRGTERELLLMLPAVVLGGGLLFLFRYQINTLSQGEDNASTLGVNVALVKTIVIFASTLMTVVSVSVCGIIGWVGLVVPHIARMVFGANYASLALSSFLIGGVFLLIIDDIVRGIRGMEMPLGILTALIGTPVFVILLSRVRKGWG